MVMRTTQKILFGFQTCLFHMRDRTLEMQPFPNLSSGILKHPYTYARNRCSNYCRNSIAFLQKLPRQPAIATSGSSESRYRYANELFKKRLNDAFEAHGLRGENYFTIHPQMNFTILFLGLNQKADVLLDSHPLVRRQYNARSPWMRTSSRVLPRPHDAWASYIRDVKTHGYARAYRGGRRCLYRSLQTWAKDSNLRKSMSEKIKKRNYVLYGDREAVAGLNQFLTQTVR